MSSEADRIFELLRAGPAFDAFKTDSRALFELLESTQPSWATAGVSADILRRVHSIRGSSGFFGLSELQKAAETIDRCVKEKKPVTPDKLQTLTNLLRGFFSK